MRTVSGMMLAAVVGLASGCGGSNQTPSAEPTAQLAPDPKPPGPQPAPAPGGPGKSDPAPAGEAGWEMDPAKHTIPTAPASGKLAGAAFTPEAQIQGQTLSFRVLDKSGNPDREVLLKLSKEKGNAATGGLKLVVRPDQPPGPDVPEIMTVFPPAKEGAPAAAAFVNGYALTLELGKREKGQLPGKIYLSLPGDEKDYLAGTFTADWVRPPTEPPGPEDTPYIQGKLTVTGVKDPQVKVGYAAQPKPAEFAFDAIQMEFIGPARWGRSDHAKPRSTTLVGAEAPGKPGRYEHVHLPPGRYLVYASLAGGPAVWKWVVVGADAQLTIDFTLDASKSGKLTVNVPAGAGEKVQLAPADEPGTPVPQDLVLGVALSLGLEAPVKDGTASFEKLGPGRYEVHAGELTEIVEVKAGETARVELKPKKK